MFNFVKKYKNYQLNKTTKRRIQFFEKFSIEPTHYAKTVLAKNLIDGKSIGIKLDNKYVTISLNKISKTINIVENNHYNKMLKLLKKIGEL